MRQVECFFDILLLDNWYSFLKFKKFKEKKRFKICSLRCR